MTTLGPLTPLTPFAPFPLLAPRPHSSSLSHLTTDLSLLSVLFRRSRAQHRSQLFLRHVVEVVRLGQRVVPLLSVVLAHGNAASGSGALAGEGGEGKGGDGFSGVGEGSGLYVPNHESSNGLSKSDTAHIEQSNKRLSLLLTKFLNAITRSTLATNRMILLAHFLPLQTLLLSIYARLYAVSLGVSEWAQTLPGATKSGKRARGAAWEGGGKGVETDVSVGRGSSGRVQAKGEMMVVGDEEIGERIERGRPEPKTTKLNPLGSLPSAFASTATTTATSTSTAVLTPKSSATSAGAKLNPAINSTPPQPPSTKPTPTLTSTSATPVLSTSTSTFPNPKPKKKRPKLSDQVGQPGQVSHNHESSFISTTIPDSAQVESVGSGLKKKVKKKRDAMDDIFGF